MNKITALTESRKALRAAGFDPVPVRGKRPLLPSWQKIPVTDKTIVSWENRPDEKSTGLRTKRMPTLDVDILDDKAASAVGDFVNKKFSKSGRIMVRIGQAPKRAIPFKTDKPFPKITAFLTAPNGSKQKIELLADGQQVVAFGVHEDTKAPYRWIAGEPGKIKRDALPALSKGSAQKLVEDCAALLVQDHGYILNRISSGKDTPRELATEKRLERNAHQAASQEDIDKVRFALSKIEADDYHDWMQVGASLADEYGEEGRSIFHQWSSTSSKYKKRVSDIKFNEFAKLTKYSIKSIFFLADEADKGWRDEWKARDKTPSEANPDAPAKPRKFELTALDDVEMSPDPVFLIEELIPAGPALVVFGGPPKRGKTFAVIDAMLHVAMGRKFLGLEVQQGAVVYVTSEGVKGFRHRMVAARRYHNVEGKKVPFYTVHVMPNLGSKADDAKQLIADINAAVPVGVNVAAVVIDTLSRAIPGKSDKEGMDMSEFIENCDIIARELQCTACVVHHAPRADEGRLRGANQLDGALDALIMVSRDEDTKVSTAVVTAAKDFEDGMSWRYHVEPVDIREPVKTVSGDQKAHGFRTVRTGVAHGLSNASREDAGARANKANTVRLAGNQSRFFEIASKYTFEKGTLLKKTSDIPGGVLGVTRDELKLALKQAGFFDPGMAENTVRARFSDNINALAAKKLIGANATYVWMKNDE